MNPIMVKFNSLRMANRKGSLAIFDYPSLEAATNNFQESNHLGEGEGDCGHFYKAHFDEKLLAAVKRIDGVTQDMEREFEVMIFLKFSWDSILCDLNSLFNTFFLIDFCGIAD